jgi:hypothetical protein
MTIYDAFALQFETPLSLDDMQAILAKLSTWGWRVSDSDSYGDKLWCYAGDAAKLQIIGESPRWVVQVGFLPDAELTPEDIRRELEEKLLPALSARNIAPTDTVS